MMLNQNPVDLVNMLQVVVGIDLCPHSTLTLLFPASPTGMELIAEEYL